jgi:hypothetical protein
MPAQAATSRTVVEGFFLRAVFSLGTALAHHRDDFNTSVSLLFLCYIFGWFMERAYFNKRMLMLEVVGFGAQT